MKNSTLSNRKTSFLRNFLIAITALFSITAQKVSACTPVAIPTMLSYSVVGSSLLINWETSNIWICNNYTVEVEIVCDDKQFTGNGALFLSPVLDKTTTPQAYPQQTVDLTTFCPGKVYKFRARENWLGSFSPWTQTYTFTTGGTFTQPNLVLSANPNIICPPQPSQLNAVVQNSCGSQPFTYTWIPSTGLSNTNTANPVATVSNNTTYTCIVEGGPLGCWIVQSTITLSLSTDAPTPGNAVANPPVICTGLTTTITLSNHIGNVQWQSASSLSGPWTNIAGAITPTLITSPLTANTCFQTILSTCTNTITGASVCVTVNPIPVLTPSVNSPNCANNNAVVSFTNPGASGQATNVVWVPGANSVNSTSTIATFTSYTGPGTVTASFPDGCVASTSFSIRPFPPLPNFTVINLSASNSITCITPSIDLIASHTYTYGAVNYFWQSASSTFSTNSVTIVNPGTYTVSVTDPVTFCSVTRTLTIGTSTLAPVTAISPTFQNITCTLTSVTPVTLTALTPSVNITQYVYSPGGAIFSTQNPTAAYIPGGSGTFTHCVVSSVNGCRTCKEFTVASNQGFPTYSVVSAQNFTLGCNSRSVAVLNIIDGQTTPPGGAVSYTLLSPTASSTTPNGPLGQQTTYTVTVPGTWTIITKDNSSLCETRTPISILSNTFAPSIDSVVKPYAVLNCDIQKQKLKGISLTPNVSYVWSFTDVPGNKQGDEFDVEVNFAKRTNTVIDNFTLTITDNSSTCSSRTIVPIYQNLYAPLPLITNGGTSSFTCLTPTIMLTNASSSGIPATSTFPRNQPVIGLRWEGPSPQVPGDNTSTYLAEQPGTYTMVAKDLNNGCTASTVTSILDGRDYPVVNLPDAPPPFVLDCGQNSVKIKPIITSNTTSLIYRWNSTEPIDGREKLEATVNTPGEYQILVTNTVSGCRRVAFVSVVNGSLTGAFEAQPSSGYAPLNVQFVNNSSSSTNSTAINSVWSLGNGHSFSYSTIATAPNTVYQLPGTYTVTMFVSKGTCLDTIQKVIHVDIPSEMTVPNIFTPNGDGANDLFILQRSANLTKITAEIFDRWGHKVYALESEKGQIEWDGKNQYGKECPEGTYFYLIKASGRDGQQYDTKGTVHLSR